MAGLCDQVGLYVCHSVCVQLRAKSYAWIYIKKIYQQYIIFIVIRIDLHCHLEVTVTKQDHFDIKLTVAQKR